MQRIIQIIRTGGIIRCNYQNVDFSLHGFDNNASEVHKSDFLRWYLLVPLAVWADMDILFSDYG